MWDGFARHHAINGRGAESSKNVKWAMRRSRRPAPLPSPVLAAVSLRPFELTHYREGRPLGLGFGIDIRIQDLSHFSDQIVRGEGFLEKRRPGVHDAMMDDGRFGVA
jgi:hypothetical protein